MIATPLTEDYKRRSKSGKRGLDIVLWWGGWGESRERESKRGKYIECTR